MNIIIFSSKSLYRYLRRNFVGSEMVYWHAVVKNGKFFLDGRGESLDVDSKDFCVPIDRRSLDKLVEFLQIVEDHPLALGFDGGSKWIWVKEAIL